MFGRKQQQPSRPMNLTYISKGSELQGDLNVDGNLRVDGIIHGNVLVLGDMEVSKEGLVHGDELRTRNLIVHGTVKARLTVEGRLTLSQTARLEGDVTANSLDIEAGAHYVGYITTTDSKSLPGTGKLPELVGDGNSRQTLPLDY